MLSEVDRAVNIVGFSLLAFGVEDSTFEAEIAAGVVEPLLIPDQITIIVSNVVVEVDPRSLVTLAIGKKALAEQLTMLKSEGPAAFAQGHGHGPRPVTVKAVTYEYEGTGSKV